MDAKEPPATPLSMVTVLSAAASSQRELPGLSTSEDALTGFNGDRNLPFPTVAPGASARAPHRWRCDTAIGGGVHSHEDQRLLSRTNRSRGRRRLAARSATSLL
jgi:hypothetical protein